MVRIVSAAPLVAHQGGWDEVLLVGGPILIIFVLLGIAKRRVDSHVSAHGEPPTHDAPSDGTTTT
jgi:hypothetical protein